MSVAEKKTWLKHGLPDNLLSAKTEKRNAVKNFDFSQAKLWIYLSVIISMI